MPHFGRLQSLPAHKGAAFALWMVRIKGGGGRAPAAHGKLSRARPPLAPEPGDARHHPELPPRPCSHGIPTAGGCSRSQGLQHPVVAVSPMWVSPCVPRDGTGTTPVLSTIHRDSGLGRHPKVMRWGQECFSQTRAAPGFGSSAGTQL